MPRGERMNRAELDHAERFTLEQYRQHHHGAGLSRGKAEPDRQVSLRDAVDEQDTARTGPHRQDPRAAAYPARTRPGLDAVAVVTELTRRLREVLDLDEALVDIDYGDGSGNREIAHDGHHPTATSHRLPRWTSRCPFPRLCAAGFASADLIGGEHGLELAALTHANEELIPELRSALTLSAGGDPIRSLRTQLRKLAAQSLLPTWINWPTDAIALSLHAAGRAIGVLTIGRPVARSHWPEDVALISDIAQRAALAIDHAQRATQHIEISQARQRALFSRKLPTAEGAEFAAEYLPASTGSDFYDVLSLRNGLWLAAIGDVCGKGAQAAARAAQRPHDRNGRSLAVLHPGRGPYLRGHPRRAHRFNDGPGAGRVNEGRRWAW
jgi:hypothetical protein